MACGLRRPCGSTFDQSLTLCLLDSTLEALFANNRGALEGIIKKARQEAARRLQRTEIATEGVDPQALEKAQQASAHLRQQVATLTEHLGQAKALASTWQQRADQYRARLEAVQNDWQWKVDDAKRHAAEWESLAFWERRRYDWARVQYEAPENRGVMGRKHSLEHFLDEYEKVFPRPGRR